MVWEKTLFVRLRIWGIILWPVLGGCRVKCEIWQRNLCLVGRASCDIERVYGCDNLVEGPVGDVEDMKHNNKIRAWYVRWYRYEACWYCFCLVGAGSLWYREDFWLQVSDEGHHFWGWGYEVAWHYLCLVDVGLGVWAMGTKLVLGRCRVGRANVLEYWSNANVFLVRDGIWLWAERQCWLFYNLLLGSRYCDEGSWLQQSGKGLRSCGCWFDVASAW